MNQNPSIEFVREAVEKREKFDPRTADPDTLAFRRAVLGMKEDLFLLPIEIGKKTVYFGGAGKDKLMTFQLVYGEDMTGPTVKKGWVLWGNENPIIRQTILNEIARINGGVSENVYKTVFKQQKAQQAEETEQAGACFTKASELAQ